VRPFIEIQADFGRVRPNVFCGFAAEISSGRCLEAGSKSIVDIAIFAKMAIMHARTGRSPYRPFFALGSCQNFSVSHCVIMHLQAIFPGGP